MSIPKLTQRLNRISTSVHGNLTSLAEYLKRTPEAVYRQARQ
ncbi:MAG: hypothetical protein ACFFFH_11360 [Candidatus Thorarchaeota archaeon]